MKRLVLVVLALGILLVTGYNIWPSKVEFVSPDRFLEGCGYEMPKPGDEVMLYFSQDSFLKLHPEVTEVITSGYEKESEGKIYVRVKYPFFNYYVHSVEASCQSIEPNMPE